MKTFKVVFHFGKEDTKTLLVQGEDVNDALDLIYENKDYFDGPNIQPRVGFNRINLKNVTYISVLPYHQ